MRVETRIRLRRAAKIAALCLMVAVTDIVFYAMGRVDERAAAEVLQRQQPGMELIRWQG